MQLARGASLDVSLLATMVSSCMMGCQPCGDVDEMEREWGERGERENPRVAARECIVIGLQMANTCNGQMIEVQCVVSISM